MSLIGVDDDVVVVVVVDLDGDGDVEVAATFDAQISIANHGFEEMVSTLVAFPVMSLRS